MSEYEELCCACGAPLGGDQGTTAGLVKYWCHPCSSQPTNDTDIRTEVARLATELHHALAAIKWAVEIGSKNNALLHWLNAETDCVALLKLVEPENGGEL